MNISGWIQLWLYIIVLLAITKPLGIYLCKVLDAEGKTFLDPVLKPFEKLACKLTGVDPQKEQDWKQYTLAMLLFSAVGLLFTYAILRLQALLPLQNLFNPQNFSALSEHLAFNTAASFTTNTNWQSYGGESTMSYFSQMVALTFHNWVSGATGIAIAAALVRGIARHTTETIGNFWTDLIRVSLYLLLPICLVYAIFLVSQGIIQNFQPYTSASLVEPFTAKVPKLDDSGQPVTGADGQPVLVDSTVNTQTIVQGPMASQIAIKMLGTDGVLSDGTNNSGPHGFAEILYAYSSATGNNGSAFAGLSANTPWYNTTLGLTMLFGRFAMIVPIMALAGSLARKKLIPAGSGTFPVSGPLFTTLLVGTVMLVGALTYFPALVLGPIVEHFLMYGGKLF